MYTAREHGPTIEQENYFLNAIDMTVPDDKRVTMDRDVNMTEIEAAKNKIDGNQTPGSDGLIP